jgi:hypothetical protein
MDALRKLIEKIWTPVLDRDRLFSLVPVDLQSAASKLEYRVKEIEDFPNRSDRDVVALYTIGLWMLLLVEDGAVPLLPHEVRLIGRILERQKDKLYFGSRDELNRVAVGCAEHDIASNRDCVDPAFLKDCIGTFSHWQVTVVIGQDNDGQLTLTVGTLPTYKLRPYPYLGRTFAIGELVGFRGEFRRGPNGAVDELILDQPNGTVVARRAWGSARS